MGSRIEAEAGRAARPMARRPLPLVLACAAALLACAPARASQGICVFSGRWAGDLHEVQFMGVDEARPLIAYASAALGPDRRAWLEPRDYTLKRLSRAARAVDLAHRARPGSEAPSFRLRGAGDAVRLTVGGVTVRGTLDCEN